MKKTKRNFIELCCQLFSVEPEKSFEQINIELALKGKDQFLIEPKHLKQIGITSWVFGFVSSHSNCEELVDMFKYGLEHEWFYPKSDRKFAELFEYCLQDILLKDKDFYTYLSDFYITHFKRSKNIGKIVSIAYATGLTNLKYSDILKLHKKYSSVKN